MAIYGKDRILMFRKLGDKKAAAKLALQTEHKWNFERSNNVTKTKDGAVTSDGGLEVKLSIEAVASRDEVNLMLKQSVMEGFKLEVWDIDLTDKKANGKYGATYAQGSLANWEVPSNVEELTTISTEMTIDGKPVDGEATLTAEQEAAIRYAFADTTAISD